MNSSTDKPDVPSRVQGVLKRLGRRRRALGAYGAMVFLWILIHPAPLLAGANEPLVLSFLKFTTGAISAYALHETGHAAAAELTDTDIEWGIGTYNQPLGFTERADSDSAGMLLHAAGLTTQVICSEVILQSDSIDKNDAFVRGMMAWNIINPIVYALDYWFIRRTNQQTEDHYQGDIEGFEHYSNESAANIFAGAMAALAAYQGYRFVKTQDWAPHWMKRKDFRLDFRPRADNGFEIRFQIDF